MKIQFQLYGQVQHLLLLLFNIKVFVEDPVKILFMRWDMNYLNYIKPHHSHINTMRSWVDFILIIETRIQKILITVV